MAVEDSNIRPCKKCGTNTEHYKSGKCKPCALARGAEWRAANPDKARAYSARWRAANPDKARASGSGRMRDKEKRREHNASYYAANKEKLLAANAKWRAENQEKVRAYYASNRDRERTLNAAWRAANADKLRAYNAAWAAANPDRIRIKARNRRAKKRLAGGVLSPDISMKLMKLQRGKCACCGKPLGDDYHIDHIMPLAMGGKNVDNNIQLLRAKCNLQKSAKHPVDFMQQRGFLL